MVRIIALRKAAAAGIAGAVAMEAVMRAFLLAGLPAVDIVSELRSAVFPNAPWLGFSAAVAAHLAVGVSWTVFYAYLFWARVKWPPPLQGLAFAVLPALLAILIVYPQLKLMQLSALTTTLSLNSFFAPLTAAPVASLLAGHAAFGLVMGAIYRRPVGYPVGHKPRRPSPPRRSKRGRPANHPAGFIFATGVECSYPTVEHGRWRRDEMESTDHYRLWQRDFELAGEIGATHIRYGPPLHLIFDGPARWDWNYADAQMAYLHEHGPEPIVDLCHFGVPSWLGDFQNPELPQALGEYAAAFAERYPWVRFYTPINEMYVCARTSALQGVWNEQRADERSFVTATLNLARASIRMSDSILERRPDAIFINSESSEFYQPCCPDEPIRQMADRENERRFLPLDLIYAHPLSDTMRELVQSHGVDASEIDDFARHKVPRRSILGVDYYEWNERLIDREGHAQALGELFGWYVIADQYWRRYGRPMMHTETNKMDTDGAPAWLWRQWHNVQLLGRAGVPLVGFTWYSLTDQIDWTNGMREPLGIVFPVGLFDLNREARAVGLSYKQLIEMFRDQPGYKECDALKELMG
jgi:beta-glucosidase/6-phospho-beta-glucosidase/beta-galactosidase